MLADETLTDWIPTAKSINIFCRQSFVLCGIKFQTFVSPPDTFFLFNIDNSVGTILCDSSALTPEQNELDTFCPILMLLLFFKLYWFCITELHQMDYC